MAQSPEYPDLRWMPPKSWTNANRSSVQLVVIHTTEGAARSSAAEDGAAYDQRRTDGTSTHYFHDSTSTIQCVHTADQAHAARTQGNRRGIQHELCTRAGSADWADTYHQAMLRRAAKQAARDARKWGIPVRHLTAAQVADGAQGFCGHWDITRAFPQDGGTHTDPGANFPWTQFLNLVRDELDGDDMPTAKEIVDELLGTELPFPYDTARPTRTIRDLLRYIPSRDIIAAAVWDHTEPNPLDLDEQGNPKPGRVGGWIRLMEQRAADRQAQLVAALGDVDEQVIAGLSQAGQSDEEVAAALKSALGDRAESVGRLLAGA
jgi:hypothetical protein